MVIVVLTHLLRCFSCNMYGKVDEYVVHDWESILSNLEKESIDKDQYDYNDEYPGVVSSISVVITGFTKLDY